MNLIFLKSETDPDQGFKIMRTLFYLDFWYVLGKMLIIIKCGRLGCKAH